MSLGITVVYDATHANVSSLPTNAVAAGYVTGSPDIAWTPQDWGIHPGAIRIDQSPSSSVWDATADVDDYESGAVALMELAPRAKLRQAAFKNGTRPGQRTPLVYVSANNVTPVVNALISGGVNSGVGLWVANWNLTEPSAVADVLAGSGPFPIEIVQFHNAGPFDMSVANTAWLNNVSGKPESALSIQTTGLQFGWRYCTKCSSLVHNTGMQPCSGGGNHELTHSHNYGITWDDLSA